MSKDLKELGNWSTEIESRDKLLLDFVTKKAEYELWQETHIILGAYHISAKSIAERCEFNDLQSKYFSAKAALEKYDMEERLAQMASQPKLIEVKSND